MASSCSRVRLSTGFEGFTTTARASYATMTSLASSPISANFIFSLNLISREAIAMSVVFSGRAEIPTPLPPPVTMTSAPGWASM